MRMRGLLMNNVVPFNKPVLKAEDYPKFPPERYELNKKGSKGEIYLYGVIGSIFDGISAAKFATDLKAMGDVDSLDIFINSPGGYVMEGRTIYTRLKAHPAKKTVHVDGEASSIASLIAMAGNKIIMAEGAMMLIHRAWLWCAGNADDLLKVHNDLLKVDETLVTTYSNRTGMKRDAVLSLMKEDRYMDADEAVKLGFADVAEEPSKIAAMKFDRKLLNLPSLPTSGDRRQAALARLAALKKRHSGK